MPEGYKVDSATLDDTELITSMWEYAAGDWTKLMTKYNIGNLSSVAVRTLDGKLVGWELQHYWGSPGMLQVLPEHQGKGLGKYIICIQGRKVLEKGQQLFIHAVMSNTASIDLHKKCGFWLMEDTDAHWGYFDPVVVN